MGPAREGSPGAASCDALFDHEAQVSRGKGPSVRPPTIEFRLDRNLALDQNVASTSHSIPP
jgi:hypothetical protein